MAYTSHGHHIRGTVDNHERPVKVARCGGPGLCRVCGLEASMYNHPSNNTAHHKKEENMTVNVEPSPYRRKTFSVEAVQVTEDNLDAVANWTKGKVLANKSTEGEPAKFFVDVPVKRPLNERQRKAYIGDWVLKARSGFKVYTQRAFEGCFEPVASATPTHVEN